MASCPCLSTCKFIQERLTDMPATAESLRARFCLADFLRCARYRLREELGAGAVPHTLFPNDDERAEQLLARARSGQAPLRSGELEDSERRARSGTSQRGAVVPESERAEFVAIGPEKRER